MKKTLMAVALAAMTLAGSAQASTPNHKRAGAITIPFDFKVQNTNLPAGEYRVKRMGQSFAMLVNLETGQAVHVLRDAGYDSTKKKLIFKEVGGQKVLEKVG